MLGSILQVGALPGWESPFDTRQVLTDTRALAVTLEETLLNFSKESLFMVIAPGAQGTQVLAPSQWMVLALVIVAGFRRERQPLFW
jgi:hypothetical protein